ncbi:MAG TPA: CSLREA domain-containing protein [Anaerolineae bacterium]|nr:CSLREA domain-containing protein [Anaerolineae bacterium]
MKHHSKFKLSIVVIVGLLAVGVLLFSVRGTSAAPSGISFNVNSTTDAVDDNPGNDICHTAAGTCTLRAAIMEANLSIADVTIEVPGGVYLLSIPPISTTDTITNGDLNLMPPPSGNPIIFINGAGLNKTIVDGNHLDRVFNVSAGRSVIINNLTMRNGAVPLYQNGGGLANEGEVVLNAVRVFNNSAAGGLGGGGLYNDHLMTVNDSLIDGNVTPSTYGGGVANDFGGSLHVNNSIIFNNRAPDGVGGGLYDTSGQALSSIISTTAVYSNYAFGGGGLARARIAGGPMLVDSSAIYSNTAWGWYGGGIDVGFFDGGDLHVINSTISGNSAHRDGGGIVLESSNSHVTLHNDTIAYNHAGDTANYLGKGGGIASLSTAVFTSQYTLMAWNTDVYTTHLGSFVITLTEGNECYGSFGYERDDIMAQYDTTRCHPTSLVFHGDPKIDVLRDNGGPTWTHALIKGSPAIDQGQYCTDLLGYPLWKDQRGFWRFTDTFCDVGAYEYPDNWIYLPLTLKSS